MEKRLNFFNKSKKKSAYKEPEQLDSSSSSSISKQVTRDGKINNNEATYAEIRLVLKTVSGFTMNSVDDVCDTFQKMFPDSDIATRMRLGRTKATYIANFRILSYVLMLLHDSINKSPVYCLSFDESLHEVTQECEMSLIIRFWDDYNMAKVRCLGRSVFGHSIAKYLMTHSEELACVLSP